MTIYVAQIFDNISGQICWYHNINKKIPLYLKGILKFLDQIDNKNREKLYPACANMTANQIVYVCKNERVGLFKSFWLS